LFRTPEFNAEQTQELIVTIDIRMERQVRVGNVCAVARNDNCWDTASGQSNSKCRWQCCQILGTNSYCLGRWSSNGARYAVNEGRF